MTPKPQWGEGVCVGVCVCGITEVSSDSYSLLQCAEAIPTYCTVALSRRCSGTRAPFGLTPQQEVHSLPTALRGCRHWERWGRGARPEPHLQRRQMEREEPGPHLLRKVTRKQTLHSEKASPSATRKLSAKSQKQKKKKKKKRRESKESGQ